ncbi:MAG: AAA family ATPase [Candidatus Cloacimonetes bacterium]|nr:AAA family ATPase [Candidatus Cloacimonadota bacterium]
MILLIHGPPASGKSTLASQLSKSLKLPHISRDNLCEWMNDFLNNPDSKTAQELTHIGYDLMFKLLGELSKGLGSFIIEGCINPDSSSERILKLIKDSPQDLVEIFVSADQDTLINRYLNRSKSIKRHNAHGAESKRGEELRQHLNQCIYRPLEISPYSIKIDNSIDPSSTIEIALNFLKQNKLT